MQRTPLWIEPLREAPKNSVERPEYIYKPFSRIYHAKEMQITGAFDKMSIIQKIKPKTRGSAAHDSSVSGTLEKEAASPTQTKQAPSFLLDKRAYKVIKALFYVPTSEDGEFPKAIKWDEFKRAMVRLGFSAEKLQGSAWQFTPGGGLDTDRGIHFHEPHPDSDIPYTMARQFGRRLRRVYGWEGSMFRLVQA
jgi:hypothetical protein